MFFKPALQLLCIIIEFKLERDLQQYQYYSPTITLQLTLQIFDP